jgi:hypothetical protein
LQEIFKLRQERHVLIFEKNMPPLTGLGNSFRARFYNDSAPTALLRFFGFLRLIDFQLTIADLKEGDLT